jgi:hypothetical protein
MAKTINQLAIEAKRAQRPPQLPLWPELKHAIPTDFVMSALFTARHGRDAPDVRRQIIASVKGVVIEYEGRLLTQEHADVWERLMYRCRIAETNRVSFRARSMLIELAGGARKSIGGAQYDQLFHLLEDLAKAHVTVQHMGTGELFIGGLMTLRWRADETYEVTVPEDIVHLFHERHVTFDWDQRAKIRGNLARWLQHYFCATTAPVSLAEIRRLSDTQTRSLRRFRQAVKGALLELTRTRVLSGWQLENDVVRIEARGSDTLPGA